MVGRVSRVLFEDFRFKFRGKQEFIELESVGLRNGWFNRERKVLREKVKEIQEDIKTEEKHSEDGLGEVRVEVFPTTPRQEPGEK